MAQPVLGSLAGRTSNTETVARCDRRLAYLAEQAETLELIDMLMADRERRRLEHEKLIVRTAYWLGRRMARYEVTKADAVTRIERLATAYWSDVSVPLHITTRGREIGIAALRQGVEEGRHGRRAA